VTLILIASILTLAGFVKGVFGMGLPTVSMGLLGLIMTPVQAATLLVVPTLLSNVWQLVVGPNMKGLMRRFSTLMISMSLGTVLTIGFLTSSSPLVALALGSALFVYGCYGLMAARILVPRRYEWWLSPCIGLLSGIVNGATGISNVPLVPYLNSLGLERDELVQAMGLTFTASMIALSACLAWTGHLQVASAGWSALTLVPVFAGMYLGQSIRTKMHADVFRKWFFVGLIILGGYVATRAVVLRFFA
jgi:uncharacterized membrane protein YfcA